MGLLTDDMIAAAERDNLGAFVYAVAGGQSDGDCGVCYQIQPLQAERKWRDDFPLLVVQVINSGFDVMAGQLDIFMGAGGMGFFTAVNSDCMWNYCNGGACGEAMYNGDFRAWTDAQYHDPHLCYEGGIKWDEHRDIWSLCQNLSAGSNELKDRILWDSCARSNLEGLHQNFYQTAYERVACPRGLYGLTGLRRADDDDGWPEPHADMALTRSCDGSISSGKACLTTMHDGCVFSCSWPGKVDTAQGYPCVDRCDDEGHISV
jgi:hypothetical protein